MDKSAGPSAFQHDISGYFATRSEGLLRFAVKFRLDTSGIAEGQRKLVLTFPLCFFARTEQGLLWAPAVDLNDDPAQLGRLKVKDELPLGCGGAFQ